MSTVRCQRCLCNLWLVLQHYAGNTCFIGKSNFSQFSQLINSQKKLGSDKFPLIDQTFYPNYRDMVSTLVLFHTLNLGSFLVAFQVLPPWVVIKVTSGVWSCDVGKEKKRVFFSIKTFYIQSFLVHGNRKLYLDRYSGINTNPQQYFQYKTGMKTFDNTSLKPCSYYAFTRRVQI